MLAPVMLGDRSSRPAARKVPLEFHDAKMRKRWMPNPPRPATAMAAMRSDEREEQEVLGVLNHSLLRQRGSSVTSMSPGGIRSKSAFQPSSPSVRSKNIFSASCVGMNQILAMSQDPSLVENAKNLRRHVIQGVLTLGSSARLIVEYERLRQGEILTPEMRRTNEVCEQLESMCDELRRQNFLNVTMQRLEGYVRRGSFEVYLKWFWRNEQYCVTLTSLLNSRTLPNVESLLSLLSSNWLWDDSVESHSKSLHHAERARACVWVLDGMTGLPVSTSFIKVAKVGSEEGEKRQPRIQEWFPGGSDSLPAHVLLLENKEASINCLLPFGELEIQSPRDSSQPFMVLKTPNAGHLCYGEERVGVLGRESLSDKYMFEAAADW
ncbi:hypothetical protein GUITHDRAFT_122084 [Guillardia theta CCMP2712]|uniref:Uncharacterized protein n=1 Tax=Guillardia theta (strain CCMP2712) TaxID=905079 RepID=L1I776_GUITC|nr:hypothetical protein GUITHDRAFT_122084 [Guillardia theta CCMP2712]EKX31715.1 hypothetical protein GUITHDRAFT_122084 [Guillardia theta CCMP2712]|eukprot:XP_005818695.1 hypothetical protein GUITHDRAFT_122084 [Guillardia theta CCMP2712]